MRGFEVPLLPAVSRYGYCLVGQVHRSGRRVFCFHPHASWATVPEESLVPIPEERLTAGWCGVVWCGCLVLVGVIFKDLQKGYIDS